MKFWYFCTCGFIWQSGDPDSRKCPACGKVHPQELPEGGSDAMSDVRE